MLDLVIGDQETSRIVQSCVVGNDIGSDHFPVTTTINFKAATGPKERVNMNLWAEKVNTRIMDFKPTNDINSDIDRIAEIFQLTKRQSTSSFEHGKRLLPPEIVRNICLRKTLLNNRKKATTEIARRIFTKQYNRLDKTTY